MARPLRQAALDGVSIHPDLVWPLADRRRVYARRLSRLLARPWLPLSHIEIGGLEESDTVSVLIAGERSFADVFCRRAFASSSIRVEPAGRAMQSRLGSILLRNEAHYDLIVARINPLLESLAFRDEFLLVPEWVRMFLPLDTSLEALMKRASHGARHDMARARREGYSYRVTTEHAEFLRFYHDMYLPTASDRFGEGAVTAGLRAASRLFARGSLLLTELEGNPVSGTVVLSNGRTMWCRMTGVSTDARYGGARYAAAASYCFEIEHACNLGCRAVNFGHCRSFLNDGVFRYKRKWKMAVVEDDDTPWYVALHVRDDSQGGRRFLESNPMIHLTRDALEVVSTNGGDHAA